LGGSLFPYAENFFPFSRKNAWNALALSLRNNKELSGGANRKKALFSDNAGTLAMNDDRPRDCFAGRKEDDCSLQDRKWVARA